MNTKNEKKFTSQYFDKELYRKMETMGEREMGQVLLDLTTTEYWVAISKYVQSRLMVATGSLSILDPFKNPTEIARAQGILSGLMDLQDMTSKVKEAIEIAAKKEQMKVDVQNGEPVVDEDDKPLY